MMRLYETHLPVTNTEKSMKFYVDIVGLEFAYRDPSRDVVFLWIVQTEGRCWDFGGQPRHVETTPTAVISPSRCPWQTLLSLANG